jgi:hypothetical protein
MNYGLLVPIFLGLVLTLGGGLILFTDRGLEWMYKQGIWARESYLINEKEKGDWIGIMAAVGFSWPVS